MPPPSLKFQVYCMSIALIHVCHQRSSAMNVLRDYIITASEQDGWNHFEYECPSSSPSSNIVLNHWGVYRVVLPCDPCVPYHTIYHGIPIYCYHRLCSRGTFQWIGFPNSQWTVILAIADINLRIHLYIHTLYKYSPSSQKQSAHWRFKVHVCSGTDQPLWTSYWSSDTGSLTTVIETSLSTG